MGGRRFGNLLRLLGLLGAAVLLCLLICALCWLGLRIGRQFLVERTTAGVLCDHGYAVGSAGGASSAAVDRSATCVVAS